MKTRRCCAWRVLSVAVAVYACGAGGDLANAAPGQFSSTVDMRSQRAGHSATLLPNGGVLVVGGESSASSFEEVYSGTDWLTTPTLGDFFDHTATLLNNNKVLVAGGRASVGAAPISACSLYDPATGVWKSTGNLITARGEHTATLLPGGKVLVTGGIGYNSSGKLVSLNKCELYDPTTETWSAAPNIFPARDGHTATLLPSGKVLIAGGNTGILVNAELYDPVSNTWTTTDSMNTARWYHSATLLPTGKVLVAGGISSDTAARLASAELYDSATGTWSVTGSLNLPRVGHTATLLPTVKVLVTGGQQTPGPGGQTPTAELYDVASGTWSFTGSMFTTRQAHTATLLRNGKVLVAGGNNGTTTLSSAELYDPFAELLNISTRLRVGIGDDVLIGGFIITGTDPKKVIIRGLGPTLPVAGALADPVLELHKPDGSVITNDNWKDTQKSDIEATGIPPSSDLESAIVTTLAPASYTAILRGNGGTGVGLVEIYDLDQHARSTLANISTRGSVDSGDNVIIGGIIIGPSDAQKFPVLLRAMGPSLPLATHLEDPMLELRDASGTIVALNDNWRDTQEAEIKATGAAPIWEMESAIIFNLLPGNYTAIVRGKDGRTGVALVEAYKLQ